MNIAEKLTLRRAEWTACKEFAQHLAGCDYCLTRWNKVGGFNSFCAVGKQVRDTHIQAARKYAVLDAAIAKLYAPLIAL